jgi:hypothetical protein
MVRASSAPETRPPGRLAVAITMAALVVAGVMLAAAGVLWLRYGSAVFFQTLSAGLAACF